MFCCPKITWVCYEYVRILTIDFLINFGNSDLKHKLGGCVVQFPSNDSNSMRISRMKFQVR